MPGPARRVMAFRPYSPIRGRRAALGDPINDVRGDRDGEGLEDTPSHSSRSHTRRYEHMRSSPDAGEISLPVASGRVRPRVRGKPPQCCARPDQ